MTTKEKEVQRALGVFPKYWYFVVATNYEAVKQGLVAANQRLRWEEWIKAEGPSEAIRSMKARMQTKWGYGINGPYVCRAYKSGSKNGPQHD